MEALASVIVKGGKYVCGFLFKNVFICANFQSNIHELDEHTIRLVNLKSSIDEVLQSAREGGRQPTVQEKAWLEDVKDIDRRVNLLKQRVAGTENAPRCSHLNCRTRFRLSKEAMKLQEEIKEATEQGKILSCSTMTRCVVKPVEVMPAPQITGHETAAKVLERVVALLQKEGPGVIGIWGMGGVGKTTLMKNLNNILWSSSSTNNTIQSSSTNPFGVIIWVTVSQNPNMKEVQSQIARWLNLAMSESDDIQATAIQLYARLKEKKFLLLLDDVWERLDLDEVGIPHGEVHTGSKIILTTRFKDVCREMRTDEEIEVKVLNDKEAWSLFRQNAGDVVDSDEIQGLARDVVKKCGGLPLAIITVGRAMRKKTRFELWKGALNKLRGPAPWIRGIEEKVFLPLRLSYDSLEGKDIKSCFLYCSLFPEDYVIEEDDLIQHWLAEGFLDEQKTTEDFSTNGIALIEQLKDACMLEFGGYEGTVKMHDVVRDFAVWIASSSEDGNKSLVRPRMGLTQIADEDMWESSTKRVSLMHNKIKSLPDRLSGCSMLSTLLLQSNRLQEIPEGFLIGLESLRVLNLMLNRISSLPRSLLELKELRALFLYGCDLTELPPLGELKKLEVLDLSFARIRELTREMIGGLTKLRLLNLSCAESLKSIQNRTISQLSSLQVLDMSKSGYYWDTEGNMDEDQATVEELLSLSDMSAVSIEVRTMDCLALNLDWFKRLTRYHICIGPESDDHTTPPKLKYERKMIFGIVDLSGKKTEMLLSNTSFLVMNGCMGINGLIDMVTVKNMDAFVSLKSLVLFRCNSVTNLIEGDACGSILPNLEHLWLELLPKLERIFKGAAPKGGTLRRLRTILVTDCDNLRFLIPYALLPQLENLELIKVSFCRNMASIILDVDGDGSEVIDVEVHNANVLPKLQELHLCDSPNLNSICEEKLSWPKLKKIVVAECTSLARHNLPTSSLQDTEVIVAATSLEALLFYHKDFDDW